MKKLVEEKSMSQLDAVWLVMIDGAWRSLAEQIPVVEESND